MKPRKQPFDSTIVRVDGHACIRIKQKNVQVPIVDLDVGAGTYAVVDDNGLVIKTLKVHEWTHGSHVAYQHLNCRCDPCRIAYRDYLSDSRARKHEILLELSGAQLEADLAPGPETEAKLAEAKGKVEARRRTGGRSAERHPRETS